MAIVELIELRQYLKQLRKARVFGSEIKPFLGAIDVAVRTLTKDTFK